MPTDMSAKAVTTRLRRASQLRRLCLSLAKAKPVEGEDQTDPPTRAQTSQEPSRQSEE